MHCTLLLLLLASQSHATPVCNESTHLTYYFQRCLDDWQCRENLHLFPDEQWNFEQLLSTELMQSMNLTAAEICADEVLWMAVLRTANVCYPNHFRDVDGTCVLFGDKLKDPCVVHRTGFAGLASPLINVGILIIVIWLAARQLDDWKRLQHQLAEHRGATPEQKTTEFQFKF